MSGPSPDDVFNVEELAQRVIALTLARMIGTKEIDPLKINSKKKFHQLIDQLGRSEDNAFEFHINHLPERINSIRITLESGDPQSAIVLLHTLIESEVNTVTRLFLRVRGFTNTQIKTAIAGIDLKSKIDVLLPVLGVQVNARIHQLTTESQRIRNAIVHFKANPTFTSDVGEVAGDHEASELKALEFFSRNSIVAIERDLGRFVDDCGSQCPEIQTAYALLERHRAKPIPSGIRK